MCKFDLVDSVCHIKEDSRLPFLGFDGLGSDF